MVHNDRSAVFWNEQRVAVDHNLFEILTEQPFAIWTSLVSTPQIIARELFGRSNLGEGALKTEGIDILKFQITHPRFFDSIVLRLLTDCFETLSKRPIYPLDIEIQQPDRRALDDIIFDVLGLTAGEREAVYEAVVNLVRARLEKAKSV